MIENIRKYTGLMAVVFVLLAAGFLFTMQDFSSRGGSAGGGSTVLEVYDRALDQQEYQRMGDRTLQLATEAGLSNYINLLMISDIRQLQQAFQYRINYYNLIGRNLTNKDVNRFVANRMILQQAIKEMGIYASEEEVTESLKTSQRFAPDGKFDAAAYSEFIEKRIGKLGMTEKDLRQIVRENLCLNKLINIVGGGLIPPRTSVRDLLEAQSQTVTFSRIVFNRDDFVKTENPTEQEIKTYWEAHQDAYKTEEKRRINYLLLNLPSDTVQDKKAPSPDITADDPADLAKEKTEADKDEKRDLAAKQLKHQINEISQKIYDRMEEKKPLELDAILAERNLKLVKTELFDLSNMPEEIATLPMRGAVNQGRTLAQEIFSVAPSSDPYDLISDPLPVGDHGWIIFTLEEIVQPTLLDYASARNKARAQLISENASKKVKKAAKEARHAIVEIMKSGKTFDTAAMEKGLTTEQVGPYSIGGIPPKNEPSYQQLFQTASGLNPGEVSEPIDENDRSLLIHVDKREIEDTEENQSRIDFTLEGTKNELMILTFMNWLNHQYEKAEVKGIATKEQ